MSFTIRRKVVLGFVISVLALAGVGWLSLRTMTQLVETQQWVTHAREVIGTLDEGRSILTDAETAQRGYLLTGNGSFLRDCDEALAKVNGWVEKIGSITADNQAQGRRLKELEPLIQQRLTILKDRIRLRDTEGLEAVAAVVATRQGKELMDRVRQGLDEMRHAEDQLLWERQAAVHLRARISFITILIGSVLACVVGIGALVVIRRDLKSREQVERQVQEGRALLHSILDNTPAVVYLKDLEGRYLFVNRRFQELTGRTRAEMIGKTVYEVTRKDLAEQAHEHHLTVMKSPGPVEFEETVMHPDGPHTHLSVKFPVRDASGKVYGTAGVSTDISEHIRAKTALQKAKDELEARVVERTTELAAFNVALAESEQRMRAVLDASLNAVIVMDSDGTIADWNSQAEKMFGWAASEVLGRKLSDIIIPPRYREAHERGMKHFFQTGVGPVLNQLTELSALRRNGHEFPVEVSISTLRTGENITFCGFVTDITERKQAAKHEAAFAKLGRSLSAAATADAAARIIAEVADELLGWDACSLDVYEAKTNTIHPIINIDTIDGQRTDVSPAYADQSPSENVRRVLEGDGQLILRSEPLEFTEGMKPFGNTSRPSASLMYVPIRRGQKVIGILSIQSYAPQAYDEKGLNLLQTLADQCGGAMERVRAEENLHQLNAELEQRVHERTAQLQAVNKELEAFSYSVSHDLRAPLRHISGFAELINQSTESGLDESNKRYLGIISDAARQMGTLIDDLLVFSRMGRAEMRRVRVNMNELVGEVMEEMKQDFNGRDIAWEVNPLPEVTGDRAMLKQVWVNLLSNAVKYTRQREPATIKITSRKEDGAGWEFSVRDNGAGFDMQYAGKLFGVFQRLHQAEEFEGTGIGLANVQRIILRHGGRVWAEAKVDAGATFYFLLPDSKKENP